MLYGQTNKHNQSMKKIKVLTVSYWPSNKSEISKYINENMWLNKTKAKHNHEHQ